MKWTSLITENALLRPMQLADVPRQATFFRDAELAELDSSTPEAYAAMDAEAFVGEHMHPGKDSAFFAIEAEGEYVGYCGLMRLDDPDRVYELGIVIGDRRCWNRGLGRKIVARLLRHGFTDLQARIIELTTHAANPRALACFTACGFVESKRTAAATRFGGRRVDMIEMAITRAGWEGGQ